MSAMDGLRRLGLVPGQDVALIGCDDIPIAAHVRPQLTAFSMDLEALGLRLGRMVQARLQGDTTPMQDLITAPMVVRQSDCPSGAGGHDET
jgi:LacI family transcriptional regulator